MPRDGNFALTVFGRRRIVHEPMRYGVAVKWMVDIGKIVAWAFVVEISVPERWTKPDRGDAVTDEYMYCLESSFF
jgi:hypothetical protein